MELCDLPAHRLVNLIRRREVSAVEVLESTLARIAAVDGRPGALDDGDLQSISCDPNHSEMTERDILEEFYGVCVTDQPD